MYDFLISAINALVDFVTTHHGERPYADYDELLSLDSEVATLCQVTGLTLPPITYRCHYGNDFQGYCKIPVILSTTGVHIFCDRGWLIAMRGLQRVAELKLAQDQRPRDSARNPEAPDTNTNQFFEAVNQSVNRSSDRDSLSASVKKLWGRDPTQAFERLRDCVCEALDIVGEVHRRALEAPPDETLRDFGFSGMLIRRLYERVCVAQAIWFDTPISRYLDRPGDPVYLDHLDSRAVGRVSGSCQHDLALRVAVGLLRGLESSQTTGDYVALMRFHTAAGGFVGQHMANLGSAVRCECQAGLARWRAEAQTRTAPTAGAGAPMADPPADRAGDKAKDRLSEPETVNRADACYGQAEAGTSEKPAGGQASNVAEAPPAPAEDGADATDVDPERNKPADRADDDCDQAKEGQTTGGCEDPALSPLEYDILQALFMARATDAEKRQTAGAIAQKVGGGTTAESCKAPISHLNKLGLVATKEGRKGGCWLTTKGQALIKRVRKL
jgi:hypothetical protein